MNFDVGSLVRARGREWVVLPESEMEREILRLRPLDGSDEEVTGIYLPLETVEEAAFSLPDPEAGLGDHRSCRLLRDAARLGLRSAAGPFRSLARLAVEPRPYQLVPLLMALRLQPVRLLIADDVGIGKTVEACLIARELLDRGEIRRLAVLCPPALADHWQRTLSEQFHLDAVTVLAGTAARLERRLRPGESIFDHAHLVISTDYVKSERRRDELVRACPELVIVDEAHTCTTGQRHELVERLAGEAQRHLVLVTATPHNGNGNAFRSLVALLDAGLDLPADLNDAGAEEQKRLARHFVQRRRSDLRDYLGVDTLFPERELREERYELSKAYKAFIERLINYFRVLIDEDEVPEHRRRRRWWSVLTILRALASSPAAAAAALRTRAADAMSRTDDDVDEIGCRAVFDLDVEHGEGIGLVPGILTEEDAASIELRHFRRLARNVGKLTGAADHKLRRASELVRDLLAEGFSPILFCRFIPTVEYLSAALRAALGDQAAVEPITGNMPPEERERRLEVLGRQPRRVLVTTDCLSEGINLQKHFDAVVHYDLSWNPTRHEQREGRVDRYGQPRPQVRTITFYGADNPIDGAILDVLLRKHQRIRRESGITVPVPMDSDAVAEAIFQNMLLRAKSGEQFHLEHLEPLRKRVEERLDATVEREAKIRRLLVQPAISPQEVTRELATTRRALGDDRVVEDFVLTALPLLGIRCTGRDPTAIDLRDAPPGLRAAVEEESAPEVRVVFRPPAAGGVPWITRTHRLLGRLTSYLLETAMRPSQPGPVRRCAVVPTAAVERPATVLLVRLRFHVVDPDRAQPLLAEDVVLTGFTGHPESARWCREEELERLLHAAPAGELPPAVARSRLRAVLRRFDALRPRLEEIADDRGDMLRADHLRVRPATAGLEVRPLPPDVLGVFLYLPATSAQAPGGEP